MISDVFCPTIILQLINETQRILCWHPFWLVTGTEQQTQQMITILYSVYTCWSSTHGLVTNSGIPLSTISVPNLNRPITGKRLSSFTSNIEFWPHIHTSALLQSIGETLCCRLPFMSHNKNYVIVISFNEQSTMKALKELFLSLSDFVRPMIEVQTIILLLIRSYDPTYTRI